MLDSKSPLIIPVEEQVRELNAKLLFACVAADRGFRVILGSRAHLHHRAAFLPRGIYLAKSMRSLSVRMFKILRQLGHEIVAWEEEGLVPYPAEYYYERRMSPDTLRHVSVLFAWGRANAELFRNYAACEGTPIHITGNPRADLMRAELRPFFQDQVEQLRRQFGRFILVNTNFGILNHFSPQLNMLAQAQEPGEAEEKEDFRAGLAVHRFAMLSHFQELIPSLSRAFPDYTVVVRPHPVENHGPWQSIAEPLDNVQVVHEGNVIPWLLASKALVHNSCTTGVEAYLLKVPAVAYQPVTSDRFDGHLPNSLSYRAFDFEELRATLRRIVQGEMGACDEPDQRKLIRQSIDSLEGPLASDRIVDILEDVDSQVASRRAPGAAAYAKGWLHSNLRAVEKKVSSRFPGHRTHVAFQDHRFPGVSVEELEDRIGRFGRHLSRFENLEVRPIARHIFEIFQAR
jgi:surface carbohydrate biosynthesis protein